MWDPLHTPTAPTATAPTAVCVESQMWDPLHRAGRSSPS